METEFIHAAASEVTEVEVKQSFIEEVGRGGKRRVDVSQSFDHRTTKGRLDNVDSAKDFR